MNALSLMRLCASDLTAFDIEHPEKEAELIVTTMAGFDRARLYRDNPSLDKDATEKIKDAMKRRCRREPMAYILGSVDFFGLRIITGPGVLIPRPETELIVDEVLRIHHPPGRGLHVLDLMTGSGCLALSIARTLPDSNVIGTDISVDALRYAQKSALLNKISNVSFLRGSLYESVMDMTFNLITANPPYIRSGDIDGLQPEISGWEPREALDGGRDGLDFIREILHLAPHHLAPGGSILLELGAGQAPQATAIASNAGLESVSLIKDYSGIERILSARQSQSHERRAPCGRYTAEALKSYK